ncbi:hypothetical protein [Phenylobacterium sp.]|jgi:hypothetical protein|uniref:hypothetical protein n=1 Tax=Phenylobacterium sp. TaxID=1871053 RepID=UPI002E300A40|nr:hypothetical protein [Phenylobacterium sp.]HEX3366685.1 hypothetical protein [Phenylobacterium sp.]
MAFAAVVARTSLNGMEYLVRDTGRAEWAINAQAAARFQTFRDATRAAMRLPSNLKAYALPAEG